LLRYIHFTFVTLTVKSITKLAGMTHRLLSAGKLSQILIYSIIHCYPGDDADIVVWNTMTGEKIQVISSTFHSPVGALIWVSSKPDVSPSFAFGCADGSIHVYQLLESSVRNDDHDY
jgi:WD40 repeat protein